MSAADGEHASHTAETSVSMETYEAMKRELAAKTEEAARATARSEVFETRERTRIGAWQEECKSFINTMIEEGDADTKADLAPLGSWGAEYATRSDIVAQVPLARLVSCASKSLKRSREEASALKSGSDSLASTLKELEASKAENENLRQRVDEFKTLSEDRQKMLSNLHAEIEKIGGFAGKFDFSKLTSREKNAEESVSEPGSAAVSSLHAVSAQASKNVSGNPLDADPLFSMISSRGTGGHRLMPSGTSHSHLGSSDGTGDIMMAIRNAY